MEIELSNGQIVEFPDSMSQKDIRTILQKKFPAPKSEGFGEGVRDIAGGALNSLVQGGKMGGQIIKGLIPAGALGLIPEGIGPHLLPEKQQKQFNEKTSSIGDAINNFDPYKALGTEEKPIDTLGGALQTVGEFMPVGPGMAKGIKVGSSLAKKMELPNIWKTLTKEVKPREAALLAQKTHDILEKEGSELFEKAKSEAKKRGVNIIPVSHEFLNDILESGYLPKSKANKALIEQAKSGNYEDLHKIQSDLWKKAKKGLGSDSLAENNFGELINDKRNELNDMIHAHFKNTGHEDISEMIKEGSNKWRDLKNTYYSHPGIAKMVDKEHGRVIPKQPMNVFSEDSDRMRSFLMKHPEIEEKVKLYKDKNAIKKVLKKLGYSAAGVGVADLGWQGAKTLKDML